MADTDSVFKIQTLVQMCPLISSYKAWAIHHGESCVKLSAELIMKV